MKSLRLSVVLTSCFLAILILQSCGIERGFRKSSKSKVIDEYIVHGDPMDLVDGAVLNKDPLLNISDLEDPAMELWEGQWNLFRERDKRLPPRSWQETKKANSSDRYRKMPSIPLYHFEACSYHNCSAQITTTDDGEDVAFEFDADSNGRLHLTGFRYGDYFTRDLQVVHYSINSKRDLFSVLFRRVDTGTLHELRFTRHYELSGLPAVTNGSAEYDYLLGAGKRNYWPGAIKLAVCDPDATDRALISAAARDWETSPGKINQVPYSIEIVKNAPPFSDVNHNCIAMIDTYVTNNREDEYTLGTAYSLIDTSLNQLKHVHVFVFKKSIHGVCEKGCRKSFPTTKERTKRTIRHEVGHALGLGHEFSLNKQGTTKHRSVMGYDGVLEITEHDREALAALYSDRSLVPVQTAIESACYEARKRPNANLLIRYLTGGPTAWPSEADYCEDRASQLITKLDTLTIADPTVNTLDGVEHFGFLKTIHIRDAAIGDFTPLAQLPLLQSLDVSTVASAQVKVCPDTSVAPLTEFCSSLKASLEAAN